MPDVSLVRLTGFVLAVAIGWIPLAPPEHVHEGHEAGHHSVLVHRHSAPHVELHRAAHDGVLDDDDAPVLTLSAVFTLPLEPVFPTAPLAQAIATIDPPEAAALDATIDHVELLIHGPPRAPASLRAPPSSLAL
jgi:hypothetical protein